MSDFLVPTGRIIKEYLDARDISQKDLAHRIGVSERHISQLLNGKSRLTEDMALKLECVMPDVPAGYWINLEAKYQEHQARERERLKLNGLDLADISRRFHFKEVFEGLSLDLEEQARAMLNFLGVASFDRFRYALAGGPIEFMQDGGEAEAVVVWLKLCEEEVDLQNEDLSSTAYSRTELRNDLPRLKKIALGGDARSSIEECRRFLNDHGVYFVFYPPIRNAKVRGALTTYEDHPAIYISGRFKTHDNVWFAILHEIGHLLYDYDPSKISVSLDELESEEGKDARASAFAREFFVDERAYEAFKARGVFMDDIIARFAESQGVRAGVVVGFLEHDNVIDYGRFSGLKDRWEL